MRDLRELDKWRITDPAALKRTDGWPGDETCGAFRFQHKGVRLGVQASSGGGWDHVSVSLQHRCPIWEEMEWIKRKFFKDDETAMQLHVAVANHINIHSFVLHIWRPHDSPIPMPPAVFV
jgi:hypothetical protein